MKKAVSIVLTILTILLTVSPCAFAIEVWEQYTFVDADNSVIDPLCRLIGGVK